MITISKYGKAATKILITDDRERIVACLYILKDGSLHSDSWIRSGK